MLNKTNEVYDSGKLVAELFKGSPFTVVALFAKDGIAFKNTHYVRKSGEDYLLLGEVDLAPLSIAVDEWSRIRDSLWGRVAHGHSWCGYLGSGYYAPNSENEVFIKKGESATHLNVGKLEECFSLGNLEFVLERFKLNVKRGKQEAVFNKHQIPLVNETFDLYRARKDIYAPKSVDSIISSLDYGDF